MPKIRIDGIVAQMRNSPQSVKYSDLFKVCSEYFGEPRHSSGSHVIFKTSWQGDPRVNIQNKNGMAKPYQVKQVLEAIEKAEELDGVSP